MLWISSLHIMKVHWKQSSTTKTHTHTHECNCIPTHPFSMYNFNMLLFFFVYFRANAQPKTFFLLYTFFTVIYENWWGRFCCCCCCSLLIQLCTSVCKKIFTLIADANHSYGNTSGISNLKILARKNPVLFSKTLYHISFTLQLQSTTMTTTTTTATAMRRMNTVSTV